MSSYSDRPRSPMPSTYLQNSTLALISLISGILAWTILPFVGAIVAVVTGHSAKREIRESQGRQTGDGMATAGLVMGYLQLALLVIPVCFIVIIILMGPAVGDVFRNIWDILSLQ